MCWNNGSKEYVGWPANLTWDPLREPMPYTRMVRNQRLDSLETYGRTKHIWQNTNKKQWYDFQWCSAILIDQCFAQPVLETLFLQLGSFQPQWGFSLSLVVFCSLGALFFSDEETEGEEWIQGGEKWGRGGGQKQTETILSVIWGTHH